jgi:RHS repeat-associated protein
MIRYFAFGATRSTTGALLTDKKFTGQTLDATGLYYYGARYYDATIGRFISPDTIVSDPANPQTLNRYSYCLNNPLRFIDPSGHESLEQYLETLKQNGANIEDPKKEASEFEARNGGGGENVIGKIPRTTVTVYINYQGDLEIERLGPEEIIIPVFYDRKSGSAILKFPRGDDEPAIKGGGQSFISPNWETTYLMLLPEIEYLMTLFGAGKNIVANQEIIIEGEATYNTNTGECSVNLTVYSYPTISIDKGQISLSPKIIINGETIRIINVAAPQSWPSCRIYSYKDLYYSKPYSIVVDLNPGYNKAAPCLKEGYPGLVFGY